MIVAASSRRTTPKDSSTVNRNGTQPYRGHRRGHSRAGRLSQEIDIRDSLTIGVGSQGASPLVDVTTTRVGTSLKGDELTAIPNSTDVWGALSEAPGVRMQGFDVGGSHKSQQSAYEVFGVQNQARVVSEGSDHIEGVGGTGFYEDYSPMRNIRSARSAATWR